MRAMRSQTSAASQTQRSGSLPTASVRVRRYTGSVAMRNTCHTAFDSFRTNTRMTRRPTMSHCAVARRKLIALRVVFTSGCQGTAAGDIPGGGRSRAGRLLDAGQLQRGALGIPHALDQLLRLPVGRRVHERDSPDDEEADGDADDARADLTDAEG